MVLMVIKGLPLDAGTGPEAVVGRHALRDLEYPVLLAHEQAVDHNLAAMAAYCRDQGVGLAPHAKTTLSSQLVRRQLDAGAWGMTAATPAQVRGLHALGVRRILLANVLVDRRSVRWVAEWILADPDRSFLCYVDSVAGVDLLVDELAAHRPARPLDVLLEVGYTGGRTGTRTRSDSLAVARAVAASPLLRLVGTAAFEGLLPFAEVDDFLHSIADTIMLLHDEELVDAATPPIVTAGGSSFFDRVVEILGPAAFSFPVETVLRSGCYVTHDHGLYRRTSPGDTGRASDAPGLRPALELLGSVLSRPEPGLVIVGFGRRDVPIDDLLPVVLGRYDESGRRHPVDGITVTRLNDQHAHLAVPPDLDVAVGELWSFGISHPCGAFDRWPVIPLVGPDLTVTGLVTTDL